MLSVSGRVKTLGALSRRGH